MTTEARLVEIVRGTWVAPATVERVVAFASMPAQRGRLGGIVRPERPALVRVSFNDRSSMSWDCDNYDDAIRLALAIASAVNRWDDHDDPAREDIPHSGDESVVVLRPRRSAA